MELIKEMKQLLKSQFGHEEFRHAQEKIIHSILSDHDTLAIMPTGGGKSLCYQLPAIQKDGLTIVISPLISLMQDQVNNLEQFQVPCAYYNSTLNLEQKRQLQQEILDHHMKVLYIAPEGILSPYMLDFLQQVDISLFAIDEAHCVSQWGHEFRQEYIRLGLLKEHFPKVPTIALTATADKKTQKDICKQLNLSSPNVFVSSFDRPNIKYSIVERKKGIDQLCKFIDKNHPKDTGIVYCLSRKKVEKTVEQLKAKGYHAVPYHAGLSTKIREENQRLFDYKDGIIVVATIAFGMGIDRPDVRFVAHLDLPKSIEGYYQETGRAGRDGAPSSAWMSYGYGDINMLMKFIESNNANETYKKASREKLNKMLSLCETSECRRKFLLAYFDENAPDQCQNCDNCLEEHELWDASIPAQKLMSTIIRTKETFGITHLVDVLLGKNTEKVKKNDHDSLSVFGIGKDLDSKEWNMVLRQLMSKNYIYIKNANYNTLGLTPDAQPLLWGKEKLLIQKKTQKEKPARVKKAMKTTSYSEDHDNIELFLQLKHLRSKIARSKRLKPFMIFPDKSLHEMCLRQPVTEEDFLNISGVGEQKLKKYGKQFISCISENL